MHNFIRNLPIPAIIIDKNNVIQSINDTALKFLGQAFDIYSSKPISLLFPFLNADNLNANNKITSIFRDRFGNKHLLNITLDNFDKENGHSAIYFTSVAENKESKFSSLKNDYCKNKLQVFEKFVDKVNEGIMVFNGNGELIYTNKEAAKRYHIKRINVKHHTVWNLIKYFTCLADWKLVAHKLETKTSFKFIYEESESRLSVEIYEHIIDGSDYFMLIYNDISDTVRDKTVIAEKSSQIDLFERNIPVAIFKLEINPKNGNYFTYVSDSFERLFGFQLPIYDTNWTSVLNIYPEDIIEFYNQMFESIEKFTKFNFIGRLVIEERIVWCEVKAMPIMDNGIYQFDGIILDITERKEAEIEIKRKRAFNDSVLSNIPADVAVFDENHRYLFLNMKGIANDDLRNWMIGKTDFDYCEYRGVDTSMAEKRKEYFNQAKESKKEVDWIDTIKKGDKVVYILRRFFPFYVDNVFVYMIGYGIDITEMKMAQLHLTEAEKENEIILKSALDGIIMIDKDYKVTYWNPQAEAIFGWKSNQAIGKKKIQNILSHEIETNHDIPSFIAQNNNGNEQKRAEFLATRKDGTEFPTELTIVNINEVENTHYCLFVRDISNKKAKELEVEIQNKALIKQNKSLEQFNYIASHDLQEPLISLIGFSNLLNEEYSDRLDEEGRLFLKYISKSASRMRSLITGLLEYTRINTAENLSETNINSIVEDVLNNLHEKITKYNAKIEVEELPTIYCSSIYIGFLFQNLISNAIKFSKKEELPHIVISCEERTKDWLFKIQDNGIGIPKKDINEIFIMFRRLHNQDEYDGYGIGLAHCKRIAELHNGEIWVESYLGEGSSFYFTISKKL